MLLLSKKSILVEGPTEYLLLPELYKKVNASSLEDDEISVISCNGITYQRYLDIAEKTDKKLLVLTDNDKKIKNIKEKRNTTSELQRIYMSDEINEWTWEKCFYDLNKTILDKLFADKIKSDKEDDETDLAEDDVKDLNIPPTLRWMLKHKTNAAYQMLSLPEIEIPQYIQEALRWIKE